MRDLVQHCLSLDPGARPTSMQVYDRLNSSPKGPGPDQVRAAAAAAAGYCCWMGVGACSFVTTDGTEGLCS